VARYAADAAQPGMLWSAILYSPVAHARIVRIDASAARAMPGVHAVLTGDDLGSVMYGRRVRDWPLLARERVRFIGDRVAVVAAESALQAQAAVRAIEVSTEPAVFDPLAALTEDAPSCIGQRRVRCSGRSSRAARCQCQAWAVHKDDASTTRCSRAPTSSSRPSARRAAQGFIGRPPACCGSMARWSVICTNKMPFGIRDQLVTVARRVEQRIDVDAETSVATRRQGRSRGLLSYYLATGHIPSTNVLSYTESLTTHNSRHSSHMTLRSAVDADGRFLAHTMDVVFDGGAYAATKIGPGVLPGGVFQGMAPYRVPHVRMEARAVYTNSMAGGAASTARNWMLCDPLDVPR
jgi:CO/xanthine dehydrogenase Mo-binding subunit